MDVCSRDAIVSSEANSVLNDTDQHDSMIGDDEFQEEDAGSVQQDIVYGSVPEDDVFSVEAQDGTAIDNDVGLKPTTDSLRLRKRRVLSRSPSYEQASEDDQTEEDEGSIFSDDEEEPTDPDVIDEIARFQETFQGISTRFRLINKIGEGAQSMVCGAIICFLLVVNIYDAKLECRNLQFGL
jgi:hypothetical protein